MTDELVVELFAGPGGSSTGLRAAGYTGRAIGIEWDLPACRTATAAGHDRICADVATYPPERFVGADGLIASPPCQAWSKAGKRAALTDQTQIYAHVAAVAKAGYWLPYPTTGWVDERSPLVLEVLRWVLALRPRWFACEQVPDVLPYWRELARVLRGHGYSTAAYELTAEEYGVPQTRVRAFLTGSLHSPVAPPVPTHQRYVSGEPPQNGSPDLFSGTPVKPWVSMATALGWSDDVAVRSNYGTGGDAQNRGIRLATEPAATVTSKVGRNVILRNGSQPNATDRSANVPAGTIYCSRPRNRTWVYVNGNRRNAARRPADQPAPTVMFSERSNKVDWVYERPATTVCSDARIGRPGHKDRDKGEAKFAEESVRVTIQEAAILQGFAADYPWRGTKTQQYQQVGNCVPPPLAEAILRPLLASATRERVA